VRSLEAVGDRVATEVDRLQTRYIHALDRRRLSDWLACFAAASSYVCITRENVDQGLQLAIMLDDCHERLLDRVKFVEDVWAGTFEDYTTRHFVQRLTCDRTSDGDYAVESNLLVAYTSAEGRSELLVAGAYYDVVRVGDDADATFVSKRAVLDTVATPRYLVYPI